MYSIYNPIRRLLMGMSLGRKHLEGIAPSLKSGFVSFGGEIAFYSNFLIPIPTSISRMPRSSSGVTAHTSQAVAHGMFQELPSMHP